MRVARTVAKSRSGVNGYELCDRSHRQKFSEADRLALLFLAAVTRIGEMKHRTHRPIGGELSRQDIQFSRKSTTPLTGRVRYPHGLIRLKYKFTPGGVLLFLVDQVPPVLGINQVDIRQRDAVYLVIDIADAKNTLSPIYTLSPKTKYRRAQMQCELRGIRMKRRLPRANSQKRLQP